MANVTATTLTESGEIVIFSHCGNTMIGRLYANKPADIVGSSDEDGNATEGSIQHIMQPADVYWIANPAIIKWDLKIPSEGTAKLNWTIEPLYYKQLITSTDSLYNNVYVSYPKSSVALTNLHSTVLNVTLLDAYTEICE